MVLVMKRLGQGRNFGFKPKRRAAKQPIEEEIKCEEKKFFVRKIDDVIGVGVFAGEPFNKGDYLLEYCGEHISEKEAGHREAKYQKEKKGSFIYHGVRDASGRLICIDATEIDSLGKLVNDSPSKYANAKMKRIVIQNVVHLCLFAQDHIERGVEIRYDYGEDKELMPWRNKEWYLRPQEIILDEIDTSHEIIPPLPCIASIGLKNSSCRPVDSVELKEVSSSSKKVDFSVEASQKNYKLEVESGNLVTVVDSEMENDDFLVVDSINSKVKIESANDETENTFKDADFISNLSSDASIIEDIKQLVFQPFESLVEEESNLSQKMSQSLASMNSTMVINKSKLGEGDGEGIDVDIPNLTNDGDVETSEKKLTNLDEICNGIDLGKDDLSKIVVPSSVQNFGEESIAASNSMSQDNLKCIEGSVNPEENPLILLSEEKFKNHGLDKDKDAVHSIADNEQGVDQTCLDKTLQPENSPSFTSTPKDIPAVDSTCKEDTNDNDVCPSVDGHIAEGELQDTIEGNMEVAPVNVSFRSILNDSGFMVETDLEIVDSDLANESNDNMPSLTDNVANSEKEEGTNDREDGDSLVTTQTNKETEGSMLGKRKLQKKPLRPCVFCQIPQSRLKRHILTKHAKHPSVAPLLLLNGKEQDRLIGQLRRDGIREQNLQQLKSGSNKFIRERKPKNNSDLPVMCTGCKGFFAKSYKARHQIICPAGTSMLMMPVVPVENCMEVETFSPEFQALLNTLQLDDVGSYVKTDRIILLIGNRSFNALKRKNDKRIEARKSVRARMRLTARLYLAFKDFYLAQSSVTLEDKLDNASDMFRREVITILGSAINHLCQNSKNGDDADAKDISVTNQKSGLKISILNLLKLNAKFLIGHFLVENSDVRSKRVVDFLQVLKLFEDELFGDAYYDLNYRVNVNSRKPVNLPKDDDVKLVLEECKIIMNGIDVFELVHDSFISVRSATVTTLVLFNGRRGGEPVRLTLNQWKEALNGEWIDSADQPSDEMLITYQSGKGADHLVPIMFPKETLSAMKFLTNMTVRKEAGVGPNNNFVFASTKKSDGHASGWHCINDILERLSLKGVINATKNRHRIATLLAKLQLSDKEKELIFSHFGHSENINKNTYQAAAGSMQLQVTGRRLQEIRNQSGEDLKSSEVSSSELCINPAAEKDQLTQEIKKVAAIEKPKSVLESNISSDKKYPKRTSRHKVNYVHNQENADRLKSYEDNLSDDNDVNYQPPEDDVSSDSSDETDRNTIKQHKENSKQLARKYTLWTEEGKRAFDLKFGAFLNKERGYPSRKEMENFGAQFQLTYTQVRTRIVNERRLRMVKRKKVQKELCIDI